MKLPFGQKKVLNLDLGLISKNVDSTSPPKKVAFLAILRVIRMI